MCDVFRGFVIIVITASASILAGRPLWTQETLSPALVDQLAPRAPWQHDGMCGVNVAYLWLKRAGRQVAYDSLVEQADVSVDGASVASIVQLLRRQGESASAYYWELPALTTFITRNTTNDQYGVVANLSRPLIVLTQLDVDRLGHFILIAGIDRERQEFLFFDGASLERRLAPVDRLLQNWTGVVIVQERPEPWRIRWIAAGLGLLGILLFAWPDRFSCRRELWKFVLVGGALCSLGLFVAVGQRASKVSQTRDQSLGGTQTRYLARESPWKLASVDCDYRTLSPWQLQLLARTASPDWRYHRISDALHAVRLSALKCQIASTPDGDEDSLRRQYTMNELRSWLFDTNVYGELSGSEPHIVKTHYGITERLGYSPWRLAHRGDLLAVAGELGLALGYPVRYRDCEYTIREMLDDGVARFRLCDDVEFVAVGMAVYLRGNARWKNHLGQEFCFDDLAGELLTRGVDSQGACLGSHVPYALGLLLQIDLQESFLQEETRQATLEYFRNFSNTLKETQGTCGYFRPIRQVSGLEAKELAARREICANFTAHHLEWMSLVPASCRPPRESVEDAIQSVFTYYTGMDSYRHGAAYEYGPLSHGVRAILWLHGFAINDDRTNERW